MVGIKNQQEVKIMEKIRKGRFMKLSPKSDGYTKKGLRYIDFGQKMGDKIKFLKKKPKLMK